MPKLKREDAEFTSVTKPKTADSLGVDNLVEDIFGLNIRGLKTIWTLITRPWLYFEAAKTPTWQDRYTPSFRIWFAIIAIGTFFQFIWAGQNTAMLAAYVELMKTMVTDMNVALAKDKLMIDLNVFDPGAAAKTLVKHSQLFLPFGYLVCLLIIAALFQSWGERLSFVVRLRYVFAIIIPGSIVGYFFAFLTTKIPLEIFRIVNLGGLILMFASYFAVAYLGPFRDMATSIRFGRSLGITALIIIAVLVATVTALAPAFVLTMMTAFPEPVPLVASP